MNCKVLISPLLICSIAIGNVTLVLAAVSGASIARIAFGSTTNQIIPRICIDQDGNEYPCP
ncbi:MAG: hypothetical protein QQW96_04280 [Tychonema bourrellyi B0820]|uniref:hypothetical protein n=1 Tax=Tychonema bourrellyi TaxID=54313 RepID=UPI000BDF2AA7|nr:hypothetical protein [Tychonema bourrellyi]MDQ2096847.1 hypothetical protein [Tychonema bourrellyi B0820]